MIANDQKLYVDFDATLFDYDTFHPWLINFLEQKHQVPTGRFLSIINEHYDDPDSLHRLYDHRGHFLVSTGMPWEDVSRLVTAELVANPVDFLFPDAIDFLSEQNQGQNIEILTYGVEEYQLFKVGLCPALVGLQLPIQIVTEPKADFLRRREQHSGGILIDDKYPLGLPDNWQHIWLNRSFEGITPLLLADGAVCIRGLNEYSASVGLIA